LKTMVSPVNRPNSRLSCRRTPIFTVDLTVLMIKWPIILYLRVEWVHRINWDYIFLPGLRSFCRNSLMPGCG